MTIEEQALEKLRELSPERRKDFLEFVDSLKHRDGTKKLLRSLEGIWTDIDITEEDIADARREISGNFPREIF